MSISNFDHKDTCILIVDLQKDFTEAYSGSLPVPGADNRFIQEVVQATIRFKKSGFKVVVTMDWHPVNHVSFFTNHQGCEPASVIRIHGKDQTLWPPHCVQHDSGSELIIPDNVINGKIKKGCNPLYDSYSGFQDDGGAKTELLDLLHGLGIQKIIIYGLAIDYCVRATAIDAVDNGFDVYLPTDLCRGVTNNTTEQAIKEMVQRGITILNYAEDLKMS
jgi:nicotinamidase/pyrazinamidase